MAIQQKHENIKVSKLKLWTENPRDPIDTNISDFDVMKRAVKDDKKKWELPKIIKKMGDYYDNSELPTVVYQGKDPVVYDGNRRIAVLKYVQNEGKEEYELESPLLSSFSNEQLENFRNIKEIVCNVCDKETALKNVERKHAQKGSWRQLERDYFEYRHRGKEKSSFIKLDESTGLISKNPKLNERIMKDNILTKNKLEGIGFSFDKNGKLISSYDQKTAGDILNKIVELREKNEIGSRAKKKYDIKEALIESPEFKNKIKKFSEEKSKRVAYKSSKPQKERVTQRENKLKNELFGGKLELKKGSTNDIYRDIVDLNEYYYKKKEKLSNTFPSLIRMALRLLIESTSEKKIIDYYIKANFENGKKKLSKDKKTFLANHSVSNQEQLIMLLHTGAHDYSSSANIEQTKAMSIIIGEMLKITHSKK